jgi:hypothetical protein
MFTSMKKTFCFIFCLLVTLFTFHCLPLLGSDQAVCAEENAATPNLKSPSFTVKGSNITPVKPESVEKQSGQTASGNQPRIAIDSASYNIGEIWEGEDIIHSFVLKNTGTAQLDIKNVKAG